MLAKIALVLAAAIVFAPGWGGDELVSRSKGPSELAGRILAPTFQEASAERIRNPAATNELDRSTVRTSSSDVDVDSGAGARLEPRGRFLLAALIALVVAEARRQSILSAERAPPRLLTA